MYICTLASELALLRLLLIHCSFKLCDFSHIKKKHPLNGYINKLKTKKKKKGIAYL